MQRPQRRVVHAVETSNLADILERILDKGIVIAGDIKIKLVDIELLTINLRLIVASVDKAKEMGIDWWEGNSFLNSKAKAEDAKDEIEDLKKRIEILENPHFTKDT